jgi:mRNA interferase RelE/StbE
MREHHWHVVFHPAAREELRAIDRSTALRVLAKLTQLEDDPYGLDSTPIVGDPTKRRLRIGDYRIIYTLDHGHLVIWIIQVGHRSVVYRGL